MYIKNLETAESLPFRESMRRGSGYYDDWGCGHICGESYYQWLERFIGKHVGEYFDDVFSLFKSSLKRKRIDSETQREMIKCFKDILPSDHGRFRFWGRYCYVDEDGIIRKEVRKHKNRDITVNYGEPKVWYTLKRNWIDFIRPLHQVFGYDETDRMVKDGISPYIYGSFYYGDKFNVICERLGMKHYPRWSRDYWTDLWERHEEYPYTVVLEHGTREWVRYKKEQAKATKRYYRNFKKEKAEKFNRNELLFNEHPIFID